MPVCSYLVHPGKNKASQLELTVKNIPNCHLTADENRDLFILVTESDNDIEEKILQERIRNIQEIDCLTLVFGQLEDSETQGNENV
jgi:nitrate reductase NapAB chaperone NapD